LQARLPPNITPVVISMKCREDLLSTLVVNNVLVTDLTNDSKDAT